MKMFSGFLTWILLFSNFCLVSGCTSSRINGLLSAQEDAKIKASLIDALDRSDVILRKVFEVDLTDRDLMHQSLNARWKGTSREDIRLFMSRLEKEYERYTVASAEGEHDVVGFKTRILVGAGGIEGEFALIVRFRYDETHHVSQCGFGNVLAPRINMVPWGKGKSTAVRLQDDSRGVSQ